MSLLFDPTNCGQRRLQPAARVRPRRARGAGRAKHRWISSSIRRASSSGGTHWWRDQPFPSGRRDPACSLCREDKTLAGVAASFRSSASYRRHLTAMRRTAHLGDRPASFVAQAAPELLNKSERTLRRLSTAMSFLSLYRARWSPPCPGPCDWRIDDLVSDCRGRSTLFYPRVPPSDISRTKPLVRLILKPDRPPPDGRIGHNQPQAPPSVLARRISPPSGASTSLKATWPSWRATVSRPS